MNAYFQHLWFLTPLFGLFKQRCLYSLLPPNTHLVGVTGSLELGMSFPLIITILPPHYLWFALPLARDGTVCSSLAEHLMVDSAIIISHRSVNNHYCLLTSLFMRSTVTKWFSFLVSHAALYFIDLLSTQHSFILFQKTTHHLLILNIKVFFSPENQNVQPY